MIEILSKNYQFDDITIYNQNENTTRKAILQNLQEVFINSLKTDSILILFAGHGEYNDRNKLPFVNTYDQ